jgi:hypothetical protein
MASAFFVRVSGEQRGPIGVSALKRLAASGELSLTDLVSRDGREWCKASEVKGLEFPVRVAPEPPPVVPPRLNGDTEFDPLELLGAEPSTATMTAPPLPASLKAAVERSPLNLVGCQDCRGLVSMRAAICPHCGAPTRSRPAPQAVADKFKVLRALSTVYFVAGALCLCGAALGVLLIVVALANEGDLISAVALGASLIGGCLTLSGTFFVVSEGIELFLQIELNTRSTSQILADRL